MQQPRLLRPLVRCRYDGRQDSVHQAGPCDSPEEIMKTMKSVGFRVSATSAEMRVLETDGAEQVFEMPHWGVASVFSASADAAFKAMQFAVTDGTLAMAAFSVKDMTAYKTLDGSLLLVLLLSNGARVPLAMTHEQLDEIQAASLVLQSSGPKH